MALVGPITLFRRAATRLNAIGWTRAAGSLAFTTLLGLVPLVTIAFAFVARFPAFNDFLKVLERFLLRYMLPESASALVHEYVVGLATQAANLTGIAILFVVVTAALVVAAVEAEINAIWGIRQKRPLTRRIIVYVVGLTAGPVLVGATLTLTGTLLRFWIGAAAPGQATIAAIVGPIPFLFAVVGFTVLYAMAPACTVKWRHAFVSGLLAGGAFELAKEAFGWYVDNVPTYEILYGALAAFPVFLLWIFLFWLIVLGGAAITAALADAGPRGRG